MIYINKEHLYIKNMTEQGMFEEQLEVSIRLVSAGQGRGGKRKCGEESGNMRRQFPCAQELESH